MIEEKYLDQAIIQNLGEAHPDAWTLIRLASQMYVRDRLFGASERLENTAEARRGYALADAPQATAEEIVQFDGKSEFARIIDGRRAAEIWPILDELMSITQTLHPEIYTAVINKIK